MKKMIFYTLFMACTIGLSCIAADESVHTNVNMLKRIGIDHPLENTPDFCVAVVDKGKIYKHSLIRNIVPLPTEPSSYEMSMLDKLPEENKHGLEVCSVIHQLNPSLNIHYFEYLPDIKYMFYYFINNKEETINNQPCLRFIAKALDDPNIKIINCSFSTMANPDIYIHILQKAQNLGKFLVFSASNAYGWLGLNLCNQGFSAFSEREDTKKAFGLVGGSKNENGQEEISLEFLKAGALRTHYLIAPGTQIPVASITALGENQELDNGTSLAVPHVVVAMAYLMAQDLDLTPYKAWRQLCKNADAPLDDLAQASIADQGWGYLNLDKALRNEKENHFISIPMTDLYDRHMRHCTVRPSEINPYTEYPENIISNLKNLEHEDPHNIHIQQLLRTALFERGIFLLAQRQYENSLNFLEEAKVLGLNHKDPILSLSAKKELLDKRNELTDSLNLTWYIGMVNTAIHCQISESEKRDKLDTTFLKKVADQGYEPAKKLLEDTIVQDIFTKFDSKEEYVALLKSYLESFKGYKFSDESNNKLSLNLWFFASTMITNDIFNKSILELAELIHRLTPDGKNINLLLSALVTKLPSLEKLNPQNFDHQSLLNLSLSLIRIYSPEGDWNCQHLATYYTELGKKSKEPEEVIKSYCNAIESAEKIKGENRAFYLHPLYENLGAYYLTCYENEPYKFGIPALDKAIFYLEKVDPSEEKLLGLISIAKYQKTNASPATQFISSVQDWWFKKT